ncbi:MAG: translation elongation factor Ts [Planctomycetota bacterium]|nr:translation elongation factor Ts [Planctomycetota bacterium]
MKDKIAERSTDEGVIAVKVGSCGKSAVFAEILCETDFAARNDGFKALVNNVLDAGAGSSATNAEELGAIPLEETTVDQVLKIAINTIGENIRLKRFGRAAVDGDGFVGSYVHTNNKLGVVVGFKTGKAETAGNDEVKTLARQIAMHVAGAPIPPLSIDRDGVCKDLIAKEEQTIRDVMNNDPKDSKKPENIKDKIIGGKMNRFYAERVLPEQKFVMDDKKSIKEVVEATAKSVGDSIDIVWFERWALGA